MSFSEMISKATKHHFFRYGLPFIVFITGGSFVLKEFASVRYEVSRHNKHFGVSEELLEQMGVKVKTKTLEEEYEEMAKTVNTDNWKNIRGPRPWEEDSKEYKDMIEQRIAEQKSRK